MRISLVRFSTLVALVVGAPLAAQNLDSVESRIASAVEANQPEATALLEQIVNINSGTLNAAGQRAVYDALTPRFEAMGFSVRYMVPDAENRGGHLVVTRAGSRGQHLTSDRTPQHGIRRRQSLPTMGNAG
jgi:glutamate carboxypeptidase